MTKTYTFKLGKKTVTLNIIPGEFGLKELAMFTVTTFGCWALGVQTGYLLAKKKEDKNNV